GDGGGTGGFGGGGGGPSAFADTGPSGSAFAGGASGSQAGIYGGGGGGGGAGLGGAIFNDAGGSVAITNSTITNNRAPGGAGGAGRVYWTAGRARPRLGGARLHRSGMGTLTHNPPSRHTTRPGRRVRHVRDGRAG